MTNNTAAIRELNDRFRRGDNTVRGHRMITDGVNELLDGEACKALLISAVASFNTFDEDNDPYGEHDFGTFDFAGKRLIWKIDYYAPGLEHGSNDPADADGTVRVLTIMLADEY